MSAALNIWAIFYALKGNIIKNLCPAYVDKAPFINSSTPQPALNDLTATFTLGAGESLVNLVAKRDGTIIPSTCTTNNNTVTVVIDNEEITAPIIIEAQATGADTQPSAVLQIDDVPTENSTNPVASGGVYSAIAAKQSLPSGGTVGQILAKASSTDFDVNWITSVGGTSVAMISRAQLPFASTPFSEGQLYYTTEAGGLYIDKIDNQTQVRSRIYPTSLLVPLVITYNMNGHGSNTTKTVYYEEGSAYQLTAADFAATIGDYNGYRFNSWENSSNLIGTLITSDITINSIWTEIVYVNPVVNFVVGHGPSKASYQVPQTEAGLSFSLPNSQLDGLGNNVNDNGRHYKFDGWYNENNEKVTTTNGKNQFIADSSHLTITLTAHWIELTQYTITYSVSNGTAPASQTSNSWLEPGTGYSLSGHLPQPTVTTGYRFKWWELNNAQVSSSTTITSNVTLVAKIVPLTTVTIQYQTAWGSKSSVSYDLEPNENKNYTSSDLSPLSASGYRFNKWYLSTDSNHTALTTSHTFNSNVTLVADWVEQTNIVITYQTDKGTAPSPKNHWIDTGSSWSLNSQDIQTMSNIIPSGATIPDWIFEGWYYDNNTKAAVGQSLSTSKTFVANWVESSVPLYYYGVAGATLTASTVTSSFTRERNSNSTLTINSHTGANEYFYFLTTKQLPGGDTTFMYTYGTVQWGGGLDMIGTITLEGKTFNIWRFGNDNQGNMTVQVNVNVS